MNGIRCSWADMQERREALSSGHRGSQKHLEMLRCVDKATTSRWKAIADLMDLAGGKVAISQLCHCQPSHYERIAVTLRREYGSIPAWPTSGPGGAEIPRSLPAPPSVLYCRHPSPRRRGCARGGPPTW